MRRGGGAAAAADIALQQLLPHLIRRRALARTQQHRRGFISGRSRVGYPDPSSSSSSTPSNSIQAAGPSFRGSGAPSLSASSSSTSSPSSVKLPPTSPANRKRNTDLALILSGTLGLSALIFYNLRTTSSPTSAIPSANLSTLSPSTKSFSLPIHTPSGVQLRNIPILSQSAVNKLLKDNERTYVVSRPGNPLYRYDTSSVASNPTCEDASAFTILEHEGRDYILASMFDGHSGYHTSRLMADQLEKYIARELFEVLRSGYRSLTMSGDSWWDWLWNDSTSLEQSRHRPPSTQPPRPLQKSPQQPDITLNARSTLIPEALRNAYLLADKDIVQPPQQYLLEVEAVTRTQIQAAAAGSPLQISDEQRQKGLKLLDPALSGSCSLSALIDTASEQLYVAVAGDSRAVMGTYDPTTGKWLCEVLSEDQTGRSPSEIARMKGEHPKDEADTVIMRGRVLGGLEPTRSFGDAKYKFPVGIQERLIQVFKPTTSRTAPPSLYKTPPYVTAEPVVTSFSLSPTEQQQAAVKAMAISSTDSALVQTSTVPSAARSKRFIVLATDGLYDCLSSEEVVALVAGHLDGSRKAETRQQLLDRISATKQPSGVVEGPHKPRSRGNEAELRYVFEDDNLSTHLIRNALGGASNEQLAVLLSIPSPHSRRYRDDITITVLLLDGDSHPASETKRDGSEKQMQGVQRVITTPMRSKM